MKVISGTLKGRTITINKFVNFRPSLTRIKEDVFNLLEHSSNFKLNIKESSFADISCGSGSIGIEAISRGFKYCHFNDIDKRQIDTIEIFFKKNDKFNYTLTTEDISKLGNQIKWDLFNVIYLDPPYNKDIVDIIKINIDQINDEAILITESSVEIFKGVNSLVKKKYGNKYIFFFKSIEIKKFLNA